MKKRSLTRIATILALATTVTVAACYDPAPPRSVPVTNLDQQVSASFDEIYGQKYDGHSIMYQGVPYHFEYFVNGESHLAIYFKDENTGRRFFAYCGNTGGDDYGWGCSNYTGLNISTGLLEDTIKEQIPVRIYGLQDGFGIKLSSISFLIGPNQWENIEIDYQVINEVPTPTPVSESE